MMPAYLTGIIWVSIYWSRKWIRYQLIISLVIHFLLMVEVIFYPVLIRSDDTWIGWSDLYKEVKMVQSKYPGTFIFSADGVKTSSLLGFYSDEMVYAENVIGENALQYDYINTNLSLLAGRDALFIDSDPDFMVNAENKPDTALYDYFEKIIPLDPINIEMRGKRVRVFFVYLCKNYKPG